MEPRRIEWLQEWDRNIGVDRQRTYVQNELMRLKALGEPLLYAAITAPFVEQQNVAVSVLRKELSVSQVLLRLVDGAKPPLLDPQGRALPQDLAGKVLRAKVGTRGQAVGDDKPSTIESVKYTGPNRAALARTPGGLYVTRDVTRVPQPVPIDEAIVILRQWGHGVSEEQYRKRKTKGVDLWLVEEVTDKMLEDERRSGKSKAA